ncbi:hypothetical protein [Tahibacter sp.]|uniref:hypothetical protein n=1 Tax=Tahibacter sp. TaxID=2056211 RepID=UPI0028C45246|nr:hypothetical protein [Tahibacter sp.]
MNTLILLVESESSWSPLVWALEQGGESAEDGRIVIEGRLGWLSIEPDQSVLDDFDDDERADAVAALVDPSLFVIEWRGDVLIETFVRAVPSDSRVFVDNEHGVFAPVTVLRNIPFASWARAISVL